MRQRHQAHPPRHHAKRRCECGAQLFAHRQIRRVRRDCHAHHLLQCARDLSLDRFQTLFHHQPPSGIAIAHRHHPFDGCSILLLHSDLARRFGNGRSIDTDGGELPKRYQAGGFRQIYHKIWQIGYNILPQFSVNCITRT